MKQYKTEFIHFLLKTEDLKLGDFTLKSRGSSPWFVNISDFNDGESSKDTDMKKAAVEHTSQL